MSATQSESHLLEFQDIPFTHGRRQTTGDSSTYIFPSSTENDDGENLLENAPPPPNNVKFSIFSLEFYRKFFDVDTDVVKWKIADNIWPFLNGKNEKFHPDFYGPVWLSSTLICVLAVFGGIFEFSSGGKNSIDYRLISTFATLIFAYVFVQPLILWTGFWWRKCSNRPDLSSMISIFGYSLSIYIPCCVSFAKLTNIQLE
uniref:Protein YIPF n=1 Tax=Romanomermis culicivorax TaxID=13658 RepID=A0A915JCD7_ROMCU